MLGVLTAIHVLSHPIKYREFSIFGKRVTTMMLVLNTRFGAVTMEAGLAVTIGSKPICIGNAVLSGKSWTRDDLHVMKPLIVIFLLFGLHSGESEVLDLRCPERLVSEIH